MEHLIRMKDYGFRGHLLQRHRAVALEQERSGDYRWCLCEWGTRAKGPGLVSLYMSELVGCD